VVSSFAQQLIEKRKAEEEWERRRQRELQASKLNANNDSNAMSGGETQEQKKGKRSEDRIGGADKENLRQDGKKDAKGSRTRIDSDELRERSCHTDIPHFGMVNPNRPLPTAVRLPVWDGPVIPFENAPAGDVDMKSYRERYGREAKRDSKQTESSQKRGTNAKKQSKSDKKTERMSKKKSKKERESTTAHVVNEYQHNPDLWTRHLDNAPAYLKACPLPTKRDWSPALRGMQGINDPPKTGAIPKFWQSKSDTETLKWRNQCLVVCIKALSGGEHSGFTTHVGQMCVLSSFGSRCVLRWCGLQDRMAAVSSDLAKVPEDNQCFCLNDGNCVECMVGDISVQQLVDHFKLVAVVLRKTSGLTVGEPVVIHDTNITDWSLPVLTIQKLGNLANPNEPNVITPVPVQCFLHQHDNSKRPGTPF
jgi:hypothetical protein